MTGTTPEQITDWWRDGSGRITFKVRWSDGSESVTRKRVDLEMPGDMIKDADYLYAALAESPASTDQP